MGMKSHTQGLAPDGDVKSHSVVAHTSVHKNKANWESTTPPRPTQIRKTGLRKCLTRNLKSQCNIVFVDPIWHKGA